MWKLKILTLLLLTPLAITLARIRTIKKGDSATVSDNTNGLESGVSDRSGKFVPGSFVTSNNTSNNSSNAKNSVPMKHVVAHHDGYNQLQGRDELY